MSPPLPRLVKFENFVRLSNFFYTFAGIIPYDQEMTRRRKLLVDIIFYVGFSNLVLVLFGEIGFVVDSFTHDKDFLLAVLTLSYAGFIVVAAMKMLSVWWKKKELNEFVNRLKKIFPNTSIEQEALQVRHYLSQCTRVTVCFACLYVLLTWTYNLFAIMQWLIYDRWLKVRTIERELAYFLYVPWDWHDNWTYYLLYAVGNFCGITAASGQISSDLLLCSVATQVIMHYDHVARSIENYDLMANKSKKKNNAKSGRKDLRRQNEADLKYLKNIISYHGEVLSLSAMMNDVFGLPLLVNFMIGCFVMCFVGFSMTVGFADTDMQIKLFLYLFSTLAQVYLICHYGQFLIDASTNIATAVYKHDWTNADIRYKKMLVLIAQRSQKPSYLKATSFINVSRQTMTDLLQASYKFFALLRTMYAK